MLIKLEHGARCGALSFTMIFDKETASGCEALPQNKQGVTIFACRL